MKTRRQSFDIDAGTYFYVGSAKGAGGVKARVFRHLSRKTKRFWHIDYLLKEKNTRVAGFYVLNNSSFDDCEAEVSRMLYSRLKPVPSFGCSDKPWDHSHLYKCSDVVEECLSLVYSILTENHMEPLWIQNI